MMRNSLYRAVRGRKPCNNYVAAPAEYRALLSPLPAAVSFQAARHSSGLTADITEDTISALCRVMF
jgi:hypothetical protein